MVLGVRNLSVGLEGIEPPPPVLCHGPLWRFVQNPIPMRKFGYNFGVTFTLALYYTLYRPTYCCRLGLHSILY